MVKPRMRVLNAHVYPGIAALLCGQKYFYPVGRYYTAAWLFKDIPLFSCCVHLHGGELRGTSLLLLLLHLFFFFWPRIATGDSGLWIF